MNSVLVSSLLLGIAFLAPFNIERNLGIVWVTATDVLTLAVIGIFILRVCSGKQNFSELSFPLVVVIALLCVTFAVSSIHALNRLLVLKEGMKYASIFMLFFVVVNEGDTGSFLKKLPFVITMAAAIISVWFIIDFMSGRVEPVRDRLWNRILFGAHHLNTLGAFYAIAIPMTILQLVRSKKLLSRAGYALIAVLTASALFLTYSRGSWIGLACGFLLILPFRYRWKGLLSAFLIISIPFTLLSISFPRLDLVTRLTSTIDPKEGSILSRKEHIRIGVKLMRAEPLTGVGLSNYQTAAKKLYDASMTEMVHNMFFQFGVEAGIPSMMLMLILIVLYYLDAYRAYRLIPGNGEMELLLVFGVAAFTALSAAGQFSDPFVRSLKEYFAIFLALPYAARRFVARSIAT